MDILSDTGSRWFCAAAHTIGTPSFEMETCGTSGVRFAVGVATALAAALIGLIVAWQLAERRAR